MEWENMSLPSTFPEELTGTGQSHPYYIIDFLRTSSLMQRKGENQSRAVAGLN